MALDSDQISIEPAFARDFAAAGLTAEGVFNDPRIKVWRNLPERQNALLDFTGADGTAKRWHIKRYLARHADDLAAEIRGIRLLESRGIGTIPLVAHGGSGGRGAFLVSEDLAGYTAGDKLPREVLEPALRRIATLAARLHDAGLHHRDLYLCHFFLPQEPQAEPRLIDPGRVAELPRFPLRLRWVVKDVAQLLYSLREVGLEQRSAGIIQQYCQLRHLRAPRLFACLVRAKVAAIARHDQRLRRKHPRRNVSLPA